MHDVDNTTYMLPMHKELGKQITSLNSDQDLHVLKLRSRNMQLLNKLTDSNPQYNFKMPSLVKISVMISISLDRNNSQNIRK